MFLDKVSSPEPWADFTSSTIPSATTISRFLELKSVPKPQSCSPPEPSLTTFHLFPAFPPELRQQIFRLSLPQRVLTLSYDSNKDKLTTTTPPPTLLRVSHEARLSALQIYRLSFSTSSHAARIYFNPYIDTLYLPRHGEMGYDESFRDFRSLVKDTDTVTKLSELRSVAIDHVDLNVKRPWEGYNKASFLRSFKHLEEVNLIVAETAQDHRRDVESLQVAAVKRFTESKLKPEEQLKLWWYFRLSFTAEENLLKEVCREMGREYEVFSLPTMRIRGKEVEKLERASRAMGFLPVI